jgi:putative ABC transport system permease protein
MFRFLRCHPGYVALASGILTLAIGINLLVFSIVNALWLRPMPFFEPERVVTILKSFSTVKSLDAPVLNVFDGPIAAQVVTYGQQDSFTPRVFLPGTGEPLETVGVTASYFSVLGVRVRGRDFTVADERIGAEPVAIISDRLWEQAFERRPEVMGSVIGTTPRAVRVIGIAPPRFEGARRGERAALWVPTRVVQDLAPDDRQIDEPSMMVFSRLLPGQTAAELQQRYRAQLSVSDPYVAASLPEVVPLSSVFGASDSPSMLIRESGTLAVVSQLSLLVLLGGCATIAALALTHYERRRAELAIKMALGADRALLLRELMSELCVVGVIGSLGATVWGLLTVRVIPALRLPGGVDVGRLDLSFDWRWSAVTLAATLLTLALGGIVPLWKATHRRLATEVATGPTTAGRSGLRARRWLLSFQVFATTIVLLASGLLVRTVLYSFRAGAGFDLERTVFVSVEEKSLSITDSAAVGVARQARLMSLLEELPGVRAVAGGIAPIGVNAHPLSRTIKIAGREEQLVVGVLNGTPNLLRALGVPLLAGRELDRTDSGASGVTPVVITRSLAARLWTLQDPLGQTFSFVPVRGPLLVVGISDDLAFGTLSQPVAGVVVTARGDRNFIQTNMVLKTDDAATVIAEVRNTLSDRVVRVATGSEVVGRDISQQRLGAWMFSGFGLVALLLGIVGVFGLVTYLAQARRRELGLRMALGATLSDVVQNAVATALGPVSIGMVLGLGTGAIASRVFAALLVGIGRLDPITYAVVGLVTVVPAALAALAAAWPLRTLTPSDALRRR